MKPEVIKLMKDKRRLKLSFWHTIDHYFIVLFLLFIPGLFLKDIYHIYITDTYDGVWTANDLITVALPFALAAITFYFIQYRRLRFTEILIQHTDQDFQEAVKRTAEELGWQIAVDRKEFFQAHRPWNWTASWGEMITIVRENDKLLLNSICDPNKTSSVVTYGWNKRNINTFLKNLADVIEKVPA